MTRGLQQYFPMIRTRMEVLEDIKSQQHLKEVFEMCRNTERVIGLFSKELQLLDKNTVQLMIDEMQDTIDEQRGKIDEQKKRLSQQGEVLSQKEEQLSQKDSIIRDQERVIKELQSLLTAKQCEDQQ